MIGQTISQYKILEKIGEGGMGIVYKAQDTKLDRFVALKFLPPHMAASDQDKARFVQEAKSAAALNHPNVCSIIDIQEYEQQMFIVMEFVDGHTLQEKKSSLTLKQAIDYGIQVAEGLAAAHEKGIIHRDIKPENIMIRKDGIAQIMDFGLAKLAGVSRLTKAGSTVGTLGYMSPEQVQGQETDHRSDIFSFGVLLYEMITGQSPFTGAHESAILYEIVNVDVQPPSTIKPDIDPELDRIVLECLEKDPNERMQSIKQVAIDLNRFKRTSSRTRMSRSFASRPAMSGSIAATSQPQVNRNQYLPWIISFVIVLVVVALFWMYPSSETAFEPSIQSSIILPDSIKPLFYGGGSAPLISPDGRHVAFLDAANSQIVVYSLEDRSMVRLTKTEGSTHPFWSPDGKNIGFFQFHKLKTIDLLGGAPVTVCVAQNPRGGSWGSNNEIVFTPNYQSPIFAVSAQGGTPRPVTELDSARKEGSHRWPYFLPDGKHFLFLMRTISETGEAEGDMICVGSTDGTTKKTILRSSANPAYAGGHILYVQGQTIMAQRFDPDNFTLNGDPFIVEKEVINDVSWNLALFSVSANGLLLFQTGELSSGAPVLIYTAEGKLVQSLGGKDEQNEPRFSPDGNKIALWLYDLKSRKSNLWIYDRRTGSRTRLTNNKEGEFSPLWSPDGASIIYWSIGKRGLYEISTNRGSEPKLFFHSQDFLQTQDWSRNGKTILVHKINPGLSNTDIGKIDAEKRDTIDMVMSTPFDEIEPRISPDGKWFVYISNESGEYEVYLTSLDKIGQSWKLSEDGAIVARWGSTAKEVFYVAVDGMIKRIALSYSGESVSVLSKSKLFRVPLTAIGFDVSRDGRYFAFTRAFEGHSLPPISMRINWNKKNNTPQ